MFGLVLTFSKFIRVVAHVRTSFLFIAKHHCLVWMDRVLFLCSWTCVSFHLFGCSSHDAVRIRGQVSVRPCFPVSWVYTPKTRIAGFVFERVLEAET